MPHFELFSFPGPAELAAAVSKAWMQELRTLPKNRPYCVALSGGRITRQVLADTAAQSKQQGIKLDGVEFFWGDERCVPPNDPESNYRLARELLLEPLRIPEARIHRVRGEEPPDFAASEAEAELCRIAEMNGNGQPLLDLVFLGMGEDGHVASLFPGEPDEVRRGKAVYRPVVATKPPPHRITLGYAAICTARKVWVVASGAGKEEALKNSLSADGSTPLAQVLQQRTQTAVFTDISR